MLAYYNGLDIKTRQIPFSSGAEKHANEDEKSYKLEDTGSLIALTVYDEETEEGHWKESEALAVAKAIKLVEFGDKTNELLSAGITYNSKVFSGNPSVWVQWSKAIDIGSVTFPATITAMSGEAEEITDGTGRDKFLNIIANRVRDVKLGEGKLKTEVFDATDFTELKAVDDTRT